MYTPLNKPHLYIEKLGFAGVTGLPNFLIFDPKQTSWVLNEAVLTCTHGVCFNGNIKNIKIFPMKIEVFLLKKSLHIAWASFRNDKSWLSC